jgi:uncharacterized protein DUF2809
MKRNRIVYFVFIAVVIALGLSTRRFASVLPEFLADYAGDTLWALMVFLGVGFLWTRISTRRAALAAAAFSYAIEISQLYHAAWIDTLRFTRLGGLILGYGFLWSDLPCYTAGVLIGSVLETWLSPPRRAEAGRSLLRA